MDHPIGGWYIRGDHLGIIHFDLAGGSLLQHNCFAREQRILNLIEAHAGREECTRHNMLHGELFGGLLVRIELLQRIGIKFAEALIHRCEYCVRLDAWR